MSKKANIFFASNSV